MLLRCSTVAMSVVYSYVINVSGNQSRRTQRNVVLRTQLCRQGWHASMADYRQKGSIFLFISCDKRYCLFVLVYCLCEATYTRLQKNVFGKLLVRGLLKSCFQAIMFMEWPLFVRDAKRHLLLG